MLNHELWPLREDALKVTFGPHLNVWSLSIGIAILYPLNGIRGESAARRDDHGVHDRRLPELQVGHEHAHVFAEVLDVDVPTTAQMAGQMISQGLAGDATEAFDLMTTGLQSVDVALRGDVIDAIDEYGGYFSQLGLDGQQAMGLLVEASDQGTYGIDKTGDALKEFATRAPDLADTGAQETLAGIGLSGREMANDLLAGGETGGEAMGKIVDGLLGIKDPGAQAEAAIALFGAPLEDIGKNNIPEFLAALDDGCAAMEGFAGSTAEMDDVLNDNAISSLASLKRQVEVTFGRIANWALPVVNDMSKAAADNFGRPSLR